MRFVARVIGAGVVAVAACSSTLQSGPDGGGNDGGAGDGRYPITFICQSDQPDGGADCPPGQPCPEVPLSSSSCGDLPGVLGHEAIPQTVGRPIGCWVTLPYGNPYFGDVQVACGCTDQFGSVQWLCPI